jgi:antitoxin component YwqK of YwqJK toxin-antitoxin module
MRADRILNHSKVFDKSGRVFSKVVSRDPSGRVLHGRYAVLRKNGDVLLEITYNRGLPHGRFVDFWSNGKVACKGHFEKGKKDGVWRFYHKDGSVMEILHFRQGKEINPRRLPKRRTS